jgi:uncharacterized protein (TIGR02266 family)
LHWRDEAPLASDDAEICLVDTNTRQGKRTPVTLKIKFKSETLEQFIERYAVDVSQGGIFIRTKEPLAVGTQMKFEFQLRDASPLIAGEGTVVWTRENDPSRPAIAPGMGVRFDRLADGSQGILERILAEKAKQAPQRPVADTTKPPLFTDTPTRVAPAPMQEALLGKDDSRSRRVSDDPGGHSSDSHTPLPRPMPFHSDADEFPDEAFEEATKVRALDELIAATADGASASDELTGRRLNGIAEPASERAETQTEAAEAAQARRERAKPATGRLPAATARQTGEPFEAAVQPPESGGRSRLVDAAASARNEPAFVGGRPGDAARARLSTPPIGMEMTTPSPHVPPVPSLAHHTMSSDRTMPARMPSLKDTNNSPFLILALVVVAVAGAGVWFLVLRPPTAEPTDGRPSASGSAAQATGPTAAMPTPGAAAPAPDVGSSAAAVPAPIKPKAEMVDTVVASTADFAKVEVIGTEQSGPAPLTARLERGKPYKVRVTAHGYAALELDIKGGDDKSIAKLVAKPRVISIVTDPPGALITVDSVATGRTTPSDVELTTPQGAKKTVRIQLRKSGFRSIDRNIDLTKLTEDDTRMVTTLDEKLSVAPPPAPRPPSQPKPQPTTTPDSEGSATDVPVTSPSGGSAPDPSTATPAPGPAPPPAPTPAAGSGSAAEPEPDFNKKPS